MSGEYQYYINRYWIAEYMQYLQEFGVVLGCPGLTERSMCAKEIGSQTPWAISAEQGSGWENDEPVAPSRLTFEDMLSMHDSDILDWVMRWVDPIC